MRKTVWELVFYTMLGYLVLFAILKSLGIVKSPEVIEQTPNIALIVAAVSIYKWLKDSFTELRIEIIK